jgi:hypothetical protein
MAGRGLLELLGDWAPWFFMAYGLALVGILIGAFVVRLRECRRRPVTRR